MFQELVLGWSYISDNVLVIFNPLIQFIKSEIKFGYDLDGTKYISTPFADDFYLIKTNSKTHQRIINNILWHANSTKLSLKPVKCKYISVCLGKPTEKKTLKIGHFEMPTLL